MINIIYNLNSMKNCKLILILLKMKILFENYLIKNNLS